MNAEREPRVVDELAVLDLDRTLLNSSAVTKMVFSELFNQGVSQVEIQAAIDYVESQTGNSFQLFHYIEKEFSSTLLASVVDGILARKDLREGQGADELLCEGADRLIYALEQQQTPRLILTFGELYYQEFKVALFRELIGRSEEDLPALVTVTTNKSAWIKTTWLDNSEGGRLGQVPQGVLGESLYFRTAVVIDDKNQNLQSSDERVRGILVDNRGVVAQQGVMSTAEVAEYIATGGRLSELTMPPQHRYTQVS